MITDTRPAAVEHDSRIDDSLESLDVAELSAVAAALVALVLTVGVIKALLTNQPGLDPADAALVTSVWLLSVTCWLSRTPTGR